MKVLTTTGLRLTSPWRVSLTVYDSAFDPGSNVPPRLVGPRTDQGGEAAIELGIKAGWPAKFLVASYFYEITKQSVRQPGLDLTNGVRRQTRTTVLAAIAAFPNRSTTPIKLKSIAQVFALTSCADDGRRCWLQRTTQVDQVLQAYTESNLPKEVKVKPKG